MTQIRSQIDKLPDKVIAQSVKSKDWLGAKFFFIETGSSYADPMLRFHNQAEKNVQPYLDDFLDKMREDKYFRNFMCVNYQYFVNRNSHQPYIDQSEFPSDNVYTVGEYGFKTGKKGVIDDAKKDKFYFFLSDHYEDFITERLTNDEYKFEYEYHLQDPLIQVMKILGLQSEISFGDKHISINTKKTEIQNFLTAQQLHIFYEQYVNALIRDKLEVDNVIENPSFLISPNMDSDNNLSGYIELDGFICSKNDRMILVECKNSYHITQNYLSKFLGKADLLEDVYGVEFDKYLVSTGKMHSMIQGIREHNLSKGVKIFDSSSHIENYSDMINAIR